MNASQFRSNTGNNVTSPGFGSATVVPSDSVDLPQLARALAVFGAGTVTFTGADGVDDTWTFTSTTGFPQMIPVAVSRVKATGTTVAAGNIKAIW